MSERDLVDDIAEVLTSRGFRVHREVSFLLPTWDGGDQKRRVDVFALAPESWEHRRLWTVIAIEAKRRGSGEMGGEVDGLYQARSVMFGRDFRKDGVDFVRPSVALYVDSESWTPENQAHTERETMLADRVLWRVGAAVLRRDWSGTPYFIYSSSGRQQATYRFPDQP